VFPVYYMTLLLSEYWVFQSRINPVSCFQREDRVVCRHGQSGFNPVSIRSRVSSAS